MTLRPLIAPSGPHDMPARPGKFVPIAVIAEFHHVVDPYPQVSVVIVVRLPDRTEAVDRGHPVVAEIPAQRLQLRAIRIAAKDHTLLVRLAAIADTIAGHIDAGFSRRGFELPARVTEIEVEPPIGTENEGVDAVIVLPAADA